MSQPHPAQARSPSPTLLLTIFLLTLLEFLQSGMIAFAAGPIMGGIGASPEEFSMVSVAYACVAISTISKQRWLVERLGWRNFVLGSLALFVVGCAVCALSSSYPQFLAGRAVMGLGGAAFMTSGRVLVNLIPPGPMRFTGIKYFATGLGTGIALAPGLVSFSVSHEHWNALFLILIGVSVAAGCAVVRSLPTERVHEDLRSQSHPLLVMSLASGSFLLLYGLQRIQYDPFGDAVLLVAGLSSGLFALHYFFRSLHRHERPLLGLKHLRHPSYIGGLILFTLCYMVLGANNYMLPVLIQRTLGFSWQTVGQIQTVGLMSTLVAWLVMAWALPKWPAPKKFFVGGFAALAVFGVQLSRIDGDVSLLSDVLPALVFHGIFLMFVMATTAMQTFRDVQHHEAVLSHAQQLKNMTAQFGTALGIAGSTLLLQWRSTLHYKALAGEEFTYGHSLQKLGQVLASGDVGSRPDSVAAFVLSPILNQQATLLACHDYFLVIAAFGLFGAVVMSWQRLMK